jgi:hypothetical protein
MLLLALLTASCTYLVVAVFSSNTLGATYSTSRYAVIWTNWAVCLASIPVCAAKGSGKLRTLLIVSAVILLSIWSLVAAANSVV